MKIFLIIAVILFCSSFAFSKQYTFSNLANRMAFPTPDGFTTDKNKVAKILNVIFFDLTAFVLTFFFVERKIGLNLILY